MSRRAPWLLGLIFIVSPLQAAEPKGKIVRELWDAAYIEGVKIGFFHTTVREIERDGQKLLQTSLEMDLTIRRYKDSVRLRMLSGTEETPEGKVTGISMTHFLDKGQQLVLNGTVENGKLHVTVKDPPLDKRTPWNDKVIGLYKQERIFQERKAKVGDTIEYLTYEPSITSIVTVRATIKREEEVDVIKIDPNDKSKAIRVKERLLRVEAVPDKVVVPGAEAQLPTLIEWLDKDLIPVRSQVDMQGSMVIIQRASREIAMAVDNRMASLPDLGTSSMIPLKTAIARPHEARSIVYRITVRDDKDAAGAIAQDSRQTIKNVKGNSFDLQVRAIRKPQANSKPADAADEFIKSCYWIDSDDEEVQKKAALAVKDEKDPWKKAQLIESWVYRNVKKSNSVFFPTASQIARNLEGDCRQHSFLSTAMCRAAGVPSRTAIGLVYASDERGKPTMAFHMWTEVWVNGQWLGIDSTLGRGSVGAAHIKIADHSWHDTQSLTPLLPVNRVLGKLSIEVVSVNELD